MFRRRVGIRSSGNSKKAATTRKKRENTRARHRRKKQTGKTENERSMKILGLVDLDQQWMEEIWGEGQIRRSRKHRRRGLTKSQKLLLSPIDFFSTSE
jgi:hypothetical protein